MGKQVPGGRRGGGPDGLFAEDVIRSYADDPNLVPRAWLTRCVELHLADRDCRFVLLQGPSGAGKSTVMASLARGNPGWPRYFIRRDSREPLHSGDARSFLFAIGHQLAAIRPAIFAPDRLEVIVKQRVGKIRPGGKVTGITIQELGASPFYKTALTVEQDVAVVSGDLEGLSVQRFVVEERLLDLSSLQYMALIDPARLLAETEPHARIVVLVDALDELRYQASGESILSWLASAPQLPENVRFVLASRPDSELLGAFKGKKAKWLRTAALDPASREVSDDVALYAAKLVADRVVARAVASCKLKPADVAAGVAERAAGNFQYVTAFFRGVREASRAQDKGAIETLLAREGVPGDLEDLYGFFLTLLKDSVRSEAMAVARGEGRDEASAPAWPAIYQPVLGVLAAAFEPLSLEQVARFIGSRTGLRWVCEALLRMGQFLDDAELARNRYRLYHSSISEFICSPSARDRYAGLVCDAREWHLGIARSYRVPTAAGTPSGEWGEVDWKAVDEYGLRHLSAHLDLSVGDRQGYEDLLALVCRPLMEEKRRRFGSSALLLEDAERALRRAPEMLPAARAGIYRCCFVYATLRSLSANVSDEFVSALAAVGHVRQARLLLNLLPEERRVAAASALADIRWRAGDADDAAALARSALRESRVEKYPNKGALTKAVTILTLAGDANAAAKAALGPRPTNNRFGVVLTAAQKVAGEGRHDLAFTLLKVLTREAPRLDRDWELVDTLARLVEAGMNICQAGATDGPKIELSRMLTRFRGARFEFSETGRRFLEQLVWAWCRLGSPENGVESVAGETDEIAAATLLAVAKRLPAELSRKSARNVLIDAAKRRARSVKSVGPRTSIARAMTGVGQPACARMLVRQTLRDLRKGKPLTWQTHEGLAMTLAGAGAWDELLEVLESLPDAIRKGADEMRARTPEYDDRISDWESESLSQVEVLQSAAGAKTRARSATKGGPDYQPVAGVIGELLQAGQDEAAMRVVRGLPGGLDRVRGSLQVASALQSEFRATQARAALREAIRGVRRWRDDGDDRGYGGTGYGGGGYGGTEYGRNDLDELLDTILLEAGRLGIAVRGLKKAEAGPTIEDLLKSCDEMLDANSRSEARKVLERAMRLRDSGRTGSAANDELLSAISLRFDRAGYRKRALQIARNASSESERSRVLLDLAVRRAAAHEDAVDELLEEVRRSQERVEPSEEESSSEIKIAVALARHGRDQLAGRIADAAVGPDGRLEPEDAANLAEVYLRLGRHPNYRAILAKAAEQYQGEVVAVRTYRGLLTTGHWRPALRLSKHFTDAGRVDLYFDISAGLGDTDPRLADAFVNHAERWAKRQSSEGGRPQKTLSRTSERLAARGEYLRALRIADQLENPLPAKAQVVSLMVGANDVRAASSLVAELFAASLPDTERRSDVWWKLAGALRAVGRVPWAVELIGSIAEPLERGRAFCDLGWAFLWAGESNQCAAVAERALHVLSKCADGAGADDIRMTVTRLLARAGRPTRAKKVWESLSEPGHREKATEDIVRALGADGQVNAAIGLLNTISDYRSWEDAIFALIRAVALRGDLKVARTILSKAESFLGDSYSGQRRGAYYSELLGGGSDRPSWNLLFQPEEIDSSRSKYHERVARFAEFVAETGQIARASAIVEDIPDAIDREEARQSVARIATARLDTASIGRSEQELIAWANIGATLVRQGSVELGARIVERVGRLMRGKAVPGAERVSQALVEPLGRIGQAQEAATLADQLILRSRFDGPAAFLHTLGDVASSLAKLDDGNTLSEIASGILDARQWWPRELVNP
ncbi:hypothetical protein V5E97_11440 [Singulisphaera sp. Ch08]|uniref:NACHT domain-containing protein n=1 Tax=Singulisphaera sp. Ch08 TaxID=3120278 RepID=A0AAU7CNL8_9BACT